MECDKLHLMTIDDLIEYAKNVADIMGPGVRFPTLAIIERVDPNYNNLGGYAIRADVHQRSAEWKIVTCDKDGSISMCPKITNNSLYHENYLGFIIIDTPWKDMNQILTDMHVEREWMEVW